MEVVEERIETAKKEIEMKAAKNNAVVNDADTNAVQKIKGIDETELLKTERVIHRYKQMLEG